MKKQVRVGKERKKGCRRGWKGIVTVVLAMVLSISSCMMGSGVVWTNKEAERFDSRECTGETGTTQINKQDNESQQGENCKTESEIESESGTEESETEESRVEGESETQGGSGTEEESEIEGESETESENEAAVEEESGVKGESETESESGAEEESRIEGESEAESDSGTESESRVESADGRESEPETEMFSDEYVTEQSETKEEGVETDTEPETDSERPEPGTNTEEPETEMITETNPEESETEIMTETNSEESEIEIMTETESEEPETEMMTETDPEEREPEMVTETEQEEPKTEAVTEANVEIRRGSIERGRHYEIRGDDNASYRDESDRLWVRAGTNLYIGAGKEGGYDSCSGAEDIWQDGVITFSLKKTNEAGEILEESEIREEPYFVDGEAPEAEIVLSGIAEEHTVYCTQEGDAEVIIAPDGKSGLKSASYCVVRCGEEGEKSKYPENGRWSPCVNGQTISILEEGTFQIYVRTEDRVGNVSFSESRLLCVDRTPPKILVEGVSDQSANAGTVEIRVCCKDSYYRTGSLKVAISGINQKRLPVQKKQEEKAEGASIEYYDFPHEKQYDDMYMLTVSAEDRSGNYVEQQMAFSVNRYGSVFDLGQETREKLNRYYLAEAVDIVFHETNIDYIGEAQIYCRCNGQLRELRQGRDYCVTLCGNRESWKQYEYTVRSSCFEEEGVYELMLSSCDRAENASDTGIQKKRVAFVLDRTAPSYTVTGVKSRGVFDGKSVTAVFVPHDNIGLSQVRIYHNSELIEQKESESCMEEPIRLALSPSQEWQTLQFYMRDLAGNELWSEEIPVFVRTDSSIMLPVYQKQKASARELEEAEINKKSSAREAIRKDIRVAMADTNKQLLNSQRIQKSQLEQSDDQMNEKMNTVQNGGNRVVLGESDMGNTVKKSADQMLLWTGIGVFFFTFVCCKAMERRRRMKRSK